MEIYESKVIFEDYPTLRYYLTKKRPHILFSEIKEIKTGKIDILDYIEIITISEKINITYVDNINETLQYLQRAYENYKQNNLVRE